MITLYNWLKIVLNISCIFAFHWLKTCLASVAKYKNTVNLLQSKLSGKGLDRRWKARQQDWSQMYVLTLKKKVVQIILHGKGDLFIRQDLTLLDSFIWFFIHFSYVKNLKCFIFSGLNLLLMYIKHVFYCVPHIMGV